MSSTFEGTKELFGLPADEMMYEAVECLSGDSLSHKGRLYISENYLSFSCNMIGMSKKFSIRIQDIKDLRIIKNDHLKIVDFNEKVYLLGGFGKMKNRSIKLILSLYQGEIEYNEQEEPEPSLPQTISKDSKDKNSETQEGKSPQKEAALQNSPMIITKKGSFVSISPENPESKQKLSSEDKKNEKSDNQLGASRHKKTLPLSVKEDSLMVAYFNKVSQFQE